MASGWPAETAWPWMTYTRTIAPSNGAVTATCASGGKVTTAGTVPKELRRSVHRFGLDTQPLQLLRGQGARCDPKIGGNLGGLVGVARPAKLVIGNKAYGDGKRNRAGRNDLLPVYGRHLPAEADSNLMAGSFS